MKMFKCQIELKGNYTLNVRDSEFEVLDEKGNLIYGENSNGYWEKRKFDEQGNRIYWVNSDGYWNKREYDEQENEVYYENSDGVIIDKRPNAKELTIAEIEKLLGYQIKVVK
jgi:hypothetical protein